MTFILVSRLETGTILIINKECGKYKMLKKHALYFLLSTITVAVIAADFSNPTARIKDSVDKVLIILKEKSLDRDTRWARIGVVINASFDFRSMSQSVLATNWQKASFGEREQFIVFFSQYLEDIYRIKIEAYTNQKIAYVGETIRGKMAVVETLITTDNTEIPVNYKLKNNDGTWFAYDVVIEGFSLVNKYRDTYTAIFKNDGMNGILNDIQKSINKYKASQEQSAAEEIDEDN